MNEFVNSKVFWNNKYLQQQDKWDLNNPTPQFINWSNQNKNKLKILIPGCGKGHDAIYLSTKGHDVTCIDFSSVALQYLKEKSKNIPNIKLNIIEDDFFNLKDDYNNSFDIILEYTFFCAINPSLRSNYFKICNKLLKDKGRLVGIFFPIRKSNIDSSPPYVVNYKDELINAKTLFKTLIVKKNLLSVAPRKDNEIFFEMLKI